MIIIGKIYVIDAPCGAGKTSWAIQEMNSRHDDSFIYCTPFLDEVGRIREACGYSRFKEPIPYSGSKLDNFNELLAIGESVAVTHSTFLNATPETLELLYEGGYTLIMDEALDVVEEFNKLHSVENSPRQSMTKKDIAMLIEQGMIVIEGDHRVKWNCGEYGNDSKFAEVERLTKLGRLYFVRDKLLVTVFPPEMFSLFESIYVLTYIFESSVLKYYFDLFGIGYEKVSLECVVSAYTIIPYSTDADIAFRKKCKALISICDDEKLNPNRSLSKHWYSGVDSSVFRELKNDMRSFFSSCHAHSNDIMWTCPKEYKDNLSGKGFTCKRNMTKEEKRLPEKERKELEKALDCFVSCNARATNIYRDRWALAYMYNMHFNPMLINGMFTDRGIHVDEEAYALSLLLQWICRSRIRDGKPIVIYLPSKRMRRLLTQWLDV